MGGRQGSRIFQKEGRKKKSAWEVRDPKGPLLVEDSGDTIFCAHPIGSLRFSHRMGSRGL